MTAAAAADSLGASSPDDPGQSVLGRIASPSLDAIVLMVALIVSVRIGMDPLKDNSFLTHLATGRLILDGGSIPTADPYSWTAAGREWTVQSWLASVIYAGLEDVGGLIAIRILATVLAVSLTLALWKLTDAADGLLSRSLAMFLALMIGVGLWVERPLMFGAVGLALTLLAADGRMDPRLMVPVMWVWANTHGSFPFAAVAVGLLGVGRYLDERTRPDTEIRCFAWTVVGTALAVVGPLGSKVLTFPFQLLGRQEAFAQIKEWQPIDLQQVNNRIFLVQVLVTLVALLRLRSWRAALPAIVFTAAAMTAVRNILQASIVLTPVIAAGLHGLGRMSGRSRPRLARPLVHALWVILCFFGVSQLVRPDTALAAYPEEAIEYSREAGLLESSSRLLSRDAVGNYVEYAYGPSIKVFIDDRVDMYPQAVIDSYTDLIRAGHDHAVALEEIDPTVIVWDHDSTFGRWLDESEDWEIVWSDHVWMVAVPR